MEPVTLIKRNTAGEETWRYSGQVLERGPNHILLEAYFNRDDSLFHGILLKKGDRFVETFYNDRWYNIFEMYDRDDGSLKGWYVNIGHPAEIDGSVVSYIDLALDVLVYPDGRQLILDEDEFEALDLPESGRGNALRALQEVQERFKQTGHKPPP